METIIGADEIILRLRKSGKANEVSNLDLGRRILNLISGLGGTRFQDNQMSHWDISLNARNVGNYGLPQTSEQYKIPYDVIKAIYEEIDTW